LTSCIIIEKKKDFAGVFRGHRYGGGRQERPVGEWKTSLNLSYLQ